GDRPRLRRRPALFQLLRQLLHVRNGQVGADHLEARRGRRRGRLLVSYQTDIIDEDRLALAWPVHEELEADDLAELRVDGAVFVGLEDPGYLSFPGSQDGGLRPAADGAVPVSAASALLLQNGKADDARPVHGDIGLEGVIGVPVGGYIRGGEGRPFAAVEG